MKYIQSGVLAVLLCALGMQSALPAVYSLGMLEVTPAGISSKWPTNAAWVTAAGNFGFSSAPPAISVATGASGSQNGRSLLLTDPGSATIGITGCTLGSGFSLGSNGISWTSTTAFSQLCRYTALSSLGAFTAQSELFRVESIAPASGDTQAPPALRSCSLTNGPGTVTFQCDESNDNYESDGDAPTGTSYYLLRYAGVVQPAIPTTAGSPKQLSITTIGTHPGSPSSSQSGNGFTIVGDGDVDGTDDIVYGRMVSISTDFTASVRVASTTNNGVTYPKFGIMFRNASGTNSRQAICHNQAGTDSQLRRRLSDGANTGTGGQSVAASPQEYRVSYVRSTGVLTCESSTTGVTYTALSSVTISTDASPLVGLYVTGLAATASTGVFENWNLSALPKWSYTYATNSGGTVELSACDVSANCSSYITIGTGAPTSSADVTSPVVSVQPTGSANGSPSAINWTLGTWTDAGTIRGYIPTTYTGSTCAAGATTLAEQATTAYTQSGLAGSTAYSLRAQAIDTAGNISVVSNCITATTASSVTDPVVAPTGTAVAVLGTTSLRVSWSAVANSDHYKVRYKLSSACSTCWTTVSTQLTSLSYDITGLASGSTYNVQTASANAAETVLLWNATSTNATTTAVNAANAIKWNPGTYVNTGNYRCTAAKLADDYSVIAELGTMPNVKGVHIRTMWDCLEGSTPGDYTAGFALVDGYIARAAAAGNKRLMLQVWPMGYGSCTTANSSGGVYTGGVYLPAYIKNNASMMDYCYSNQRLWSARLWAPEVMDRLIALSAAYAARYNGNPLFEMFEFHEETIGMVGNTSANFSWSAAETQWNRMMDATATQWTNTIVHNPVNYMQNDTMVFNQLNRHTRPGVSYGTTDALLDTNRRIPGQLIWRGLNPADSSDNPAWPDRRNESWVSRAMWGPVYRQQTLAETYNHALNVQRMRYLVLWKQTYYAGGGVGLTQWPEVKAFINAGSATVYSTACPTGWTCNTGGVP